jgi:hypothetical protein
VVATGSAAWAPHGFKTWRDGSRSTGRPGRNGSTDSAPRSGVWSVDFGPSPRELYRHRHVFEVIERPHRLVLASTETRLDGSSFHTKLEFTFETKGEKDAHDHGAAGISTAELRDEHARGVPNASARLERLIQAERDSD